ncbi:hypothetical protein EMCRGX_G029102 [Ephydatia muelleri]|eukprot:Em0013g703a
MAADPTRAVYELASVLQIGSHTPDENYDFEADIPHLEGVPKLEDILNEGTAPSLDELGLQDVASVTAAGVYSITTGKLGASADGGSILQQTMLKGIANQLAQASTRHETGLPTALAVGDVCAVGTSHGLVLVFDAKEQLKGVLSPYLDSKSSSSLDVGKYGAISTLDMSLDGTRLLCGHGRGLITHWDLTSNKCLRIIDNAHPPGFAVLSVKFTDDPGIVLFSNSGGNLFLVRLSRTLGLRSWQSDCIFSGSHGEALTFEPLLMSKIQPTLNPKARSIVAVATVTQILILAISPVLEGLTAIQLKSKPDCLPLLAWQFVIVQHKKEGKGNVTVDPVLAMARGNLIRYVQASLPENEEPKFNPLRKLEVPYTIAALQWINAQTVFVMDTTERIHLINVKDDTDIEVLDLKQVELVYGSSFFKSLETGGNVSKALIMAGEHACYNSVVLSENKLFLLGLKAVHVVSIKPWKERIGRLVREGKLTEALQLGMEFFDGTAKAVVGISGTAKKRKELVSEQLMDILQGFVDMKLMMDKPERGNQKLLTEHYKNVAYWSFLCCFKVRRTDLLFGNIYDTFSGEDECSKAVFLETLYDYIQDGKVKSIRTAVAKDFVEYYARRGEYEKLENCILRLDPTCLDIHQVVEICWSHQLYDAMTYVYNRGLNDYATPLLELLLQLRAALKKGKPISDDYQKIGYKLFLYIRCCVAGMAYPTGNVPQNMIPLAKTSVYEILLASTNVHNPADKASYPHMRTLLEFDTREFLNVLSLAFEEADFDSSTRLPGIPTRQELVDVLLKVMVHEEQHTFSPSQVGSLFTFLARQGSKHRDSIRVDEHVYDQVLEYITRADEEIINEERQQALIELWHSGVLQKFDEERLLIMAHGAKFFRLCELLYDKRRQFVKVLSCYLEDAPRRPQAFNFIHNVMTDEQYTEGDREEVAKAVVENFQLLISTNIKETARLIVFDFPLELEELCGKLQANEEVQYQFLQGIFDPRYLSKQEIQGPYFHIAERYIELLCKFEPDSVYSFLKSYDNYRLEEALDICVKAHIVDATAYLLERTGDIIGAFKLIQEEMKMELDDIKNKYSQEATSGPDFAQRVEKVQAVLQNLIQFCQRNSGKVEERNKQSMWFSVFDLVQGLQHESPVNEQLSEMYKKSVSDVLESMLGYISLQDILLKIMQDPVHESGHFKDIKPYVMEMLDNYNYEETLLKTTNHIMIHDVKELLANLYSQAQRGISPKTTQCNVCSRSSSSLVEGIQDRMIIFSCGHLFHTSCIGYDGDDLTGIGASCSICDKTSSTMARSKRHMFHQAQRSDPVKKVTQTECCLSSTQLSNLLRFNQSYRSADSYSGNMELRLAPPSTNGR